MPQHFKQQGYITLGQGKTFHNEMPPRWDQPFSWTEPGSVPGLSTDYCGVPDCYSLPIISCEPQRDHPFMGFVCANELPLAEWGDYKAARFAADRLRALATPKLRGRRFFYAAGFHHPHPAFSSPAQFYNSTDFSYSLNNLTLPSDPTWPASSPEIDRL